MVLTTARDCKVLALFVSRLAFLCILARTIMDVGEGLGGPQKKRNEEPAVSLKWEKKVSIAGKQNRKKKLYLPTLLLFFKDLVWNRRRILSFQKLVVRYVGLEVRAEDPEHFAPLHAWLSLPAGHKLCICSFGGDGDERKKQSNSWVKFLSLEWLISGSGSCTCI